MKLVFVIKSMSMAGGGAERVLVDVTRTLVERGHEISIISFDDADADDFYRVDPKIERQRLKIGHATRRSGVREVVRRIRALRNVITLTRPDAAIGFMFSSYIPLGLALSGTSIPVIASEHIDYNHWRRHRAQFAAIRATLPFYTAMTVLSESVKADYPAALARKMVAISNPVTTAPLALADPVGGPLKTILAVGRLTEQKDFRTLVAAFAALAPDFPEWTLRIVGEGELRGALEQQVAALGMSERIAIPRATNAIDAEYRQAQLFAHPALYESFGLVTAEALAHGLPAIGFANCPGTNELIVDGVNGSLVPDGDRITTFGAALGRLMRSPDLRADLGRNGPASVTRYSPDAVADQWETLLNSVAARCEKRGVSTETSVA